MVVAVLVAATLLIVRTVNGLTEESEHATPTTAARLGEEGVGDPDRVLTELVDDFAEHSDTGRETHS